MNNEANIPGKPINNANVIAGIIILAIGGLLLARQFNFFFMPHWLFQWPTILIIVGLFSGAKSNYTNVSWFIIVITGLVFMFGKAMPGFNVAHFVWPVVIIACGLWFIAGREQQWKNKGAGWRNDWSRPGNPFQKTSYNTVDPVDNSSTNYTSDDVLNINVVFNNCKKTILSKNFRGGEVTNVFGNTKLNFLQADITGNAVIDLSMVFCKIEIIVPADWRVVCDTHTVFAHFDDKRFKNNLDVNTQKTLILKGTMVFSLIELYSA